MVDANEVGTFNFISCDILFGGFKIFFLKMCFGNKILVFEKKRFVVLLNQNHRLWFC